MTKAKINLNNIRDSSLCIKPNATTPLNLGFPSLLIGFSSFKFGFSNSSRTNIKPVTNFSLFTTKRIYFHSINSPRILEMNFNLAPSYTREFKMGLHTKVSKTRSQFLAECFGDLSVMLDTNVVNVELQNKI